LAWLGLAWLGLARLGPAWTGLDRLGPAWTGLAWLGLVRQSYFIHLPMKMEQIECSETTAYKIETTGNYPKENILNTKHSKYKYTYYQNTHTIVKTPTHYKTHT